MNLSPSERRAAVLAEIMALPEDKRDHVLMQCLEEVSPDDVEVWIKEVRLYGA